jgi:pyruvate dehydrogenase E1 component alpha subunit
MDLMAVKKAAAEALEYCRGGNGPYFLEIMTYRYRGHSMGDPERYRQSDEVKKWQETDPIGIFRKFLIENNHASEEELNDLDKKVEADVADAVQFAESSPEPGPEELFTNIYVDEC